MSATSPLFIVDNSDEHWKGLRYVSDWTLKAEPLHDIRLKAEKHIRHTYLRQVQAPIIVRPTLKYSNLMEMC